MIESTLLDRCWSLGRVAAEMLQEVLGLITCGHANDARRSKERVRLSKSDLNRPLSYRKRLDHDQVKESSILKHFSKN
jgi:hypothetical protein